MYRRKDNLESRESLFDLIGREAFERELVVDAPEPLRLLSSRSGVGKGGGRRRRRCRPLGIQEEAAEAALIVRRYLELWSGFRVRFGVRLVLLPLLGRHSASGSDGSATHE